MYVSLALLVWEKTLHEGASNHAYRIIEYSNTSRARLMLIDNTSNPLLISIGGTKDINGSKREYAFLLTRCRKIGPIF